MMADCGLRIAERPIADCGLRIADWERPIADCGLRIADWDAVGARGEVGSVGRDEAQPAALGTDHHMPRKEARHG